MTALWRAAAATVAGLAGALLAVPAVHAQASGDAGWQACAATADGAARLQCFDAWAQRQQAPSASLPPAPAMATAAAPVEASAVAPAQAEAPALPIVVADTGCRGARHSPISRFWELERASDCGNFELRGYRPMTLAVATSDGVNRQPESPAPGRSATTAEDYRHTEMRIGLSARIKVAKDLLTGRNPRLIDSLWFGYTQQSYWQLFSPNLSRPFRTTDYQPEAMYIYPVDAALPGGWHWRYAGLSAEHQSNGRQLPESRSWNRGFLLAGFEHGDAWSIESRFGKRWRERTNDDNPDISDQVGRHEISATWRSSLRDTFRTTVRHSFESGTRGSLRLEYFRAVGNGNRAGYLNDLRLHVQLFSGYGDSLVDYNRRRAVFTVGLALVDW